MKCALGSDANASRAACVVTPPPPLRVAHAHLLAALHAALHHRPRHARPRRPPPPPLPPASSPTPASAPAAQPHTRWSAGKGGAGCAEKKRKTKTALLQPGMRTTTRTLATLTLMRRARGKQQPRLIASAVPAAAEPNDPPPRSTLTRRSIVRPSAWRAEERGEQAATAGTCPASSHPTV